jgi:hypothetical protein
MKLTALAPLAILPLIAACGSSDDDYNLPGDASLYLGSGSSVEEAAVTHDTLLGVVEGVAVGEGETLVDDLPESGSVRYVGTLYGDSDLVDYYADLGMRANLSSGDVDGAVSNFYFDDDSGYDGAIALDGSLSNIGGEAGVAVNGDGTLSDGTDDAAYSVDLSGFLYGTDGSNYYMDGDSSVGETTFTTESVGTIE